MNRNIKYGAVSTIITITVILVIVLFNTVLTFLFQRYPLNIDLTGNRIFEISRDTQNFLSTLEQDAVIYVMNTESGFVSNPPQEYFIQANEIIRRFAQYSSRVRIEYVDLLRYPGFGSRFPGEQIQMNDVIVTSRDKYRVIYPTGLFNIRSTPGGNFIASSRAEQAITSALINVTNDKELLAVVIAGHGAQEIRDFLELLILNNYEIAEINFLTQDVPPETSLLILASPLRDLSIEELRKIDAFLEGTDNRVFFYLASVVQPALPNIDEFLREWGIAVDSGIVFETDNRRLISPSPFIAYVDYAENIFSRNMVQRNLQPLIAHSRPLRAVFDEFRSRYVTTLLRFSPSSGIRPVDAPGDWTPALLNITGNVPALILSTQGRGNAHVLVSGSILTLEGTTLGNPNIANAAYFLDLLGDLTGRRNYIFVMDKIIGFTELRANFLQIIVLTVVFTVLLPLAVLSAGIVVWLRRRHQ